MLPYRFHTLSRLNSLSYVVGILHWFKSLSFHAPIVYVQQKKIEASIQRIKTATSPILRHCCPKKKSRRSRRTYANGTRTTLAEMNGKQQPRYASTISLRSLASDLSGSCGGVAGAGGPVSLRDLEFASASLVDLHQDRRRRSPSLPPIHTKDERRYQVSESMMENCNFYIDGEENSIARYFLSMNRCKISCWKNRRIPRTFLTGCSYLTRSFSSPSSWGEIIFLGVHVIFRLK